MENAHDWVNGIAELRIKKRHWQEMEAHVISCLPEEACGFLAGRGKTVREVIPVTNASHSPNRFRMDPGEQLAAMIRMDEGGLEMMGIFHSHPQGLMELSETDIEEAMYPEVALLIWSEMGDSWKCRAFRLRGEGPIEIPIVILNE